MPGHARRCITTQRTPRQACTTPQDIPPPLLRPPLHLSPLALQTCQPMARSSEHKNLVLVSSTLAAKISSPIMTCSQEEGTWQTIWRVLFTQLLLAWRAPLDCIAHDACNGPSSVTQSRLPPGAWSYSRERASACSNNPALLAVVVDMSQIWQSGR